MVLSGQLSERILALSKKEHMSASPKNDTLRNGIIKRIRKEHPGMAPGRVLALAFAEYLDTKDLCIFDEDIIAGHIQKENYSESQPVEDVTDYSGTSFQIGREIDKYRETDLYTPEGEELLLDYMDACGQGLFSRWGAGHVLPGFEHFINTGIGELIKRAEEHIQPDGTGPTADSLITLKAASRYFLRYAALAEERAKSAPEKYRDQLLRIASACRNLSLNRPSSFFEAVQLLWMTQELLVAESLTGSLSIGRIDQFLYPYYMKDMEKGDISAEAEELIDALFVKLGNFREGYQNVCLGGMTREGKSGYNDISYMGLRSCRLLKKDQPLIVVRVNSMMPDSFWEEVQKLIECGMGFPALFNDDIVIPAKMKMGISLEDARNYAAVGCVEISVGGREFSNTESIRVNWGKILEALLFNGDCPGTDKKIKLSREYSDVSFDTFDELYKAYKDELIYQTEFGIRANDLLDLNYGRHWPVPFMSAIEEGCLEKDRDVTMGGAVYNNSVVNTCAIATTVNSLIALKEAVYERKLATLEQVKDALRNDFKGEDILRQQLLNADKFGNGAKITKEITKELTDLFVSTVTAHRGARGGSYGCGFYTVAHHAGMGGATGATPDGRHANTSFSSSFSPTQGSELYGPTEVIRTVTEVDHTDFGNGMVLDMKFTPSFFLADGHRMAFRHMIETYFMLGGMEIQFNVVSRETLIAAQEDPESYRDLIVRVSGFSAYFCTLWKLLQDEIIKRTEYERI